MGGITAGILGFTVVCLVFGLLLGLIRGSKRAIIRIIIIVLCGVGAFFLKGVVADSVKTVDIGGKTLDEMIGTALPSEIPESVSTLINNLIAIIISFVSYFIIFFLLQFVSWMIIFPICKLIFCGKDRRLKRELKEKGEKYKRHRLIGMLIGALQGLVVAFLVCAPLNGLLVRANDFANINLGGETIGEKLPEGIGLSEYADSAVCKVYSATGDWYFVALTTADGTSFSDASGAIVAVAGFASEVTALTESMDSFNFDEGLTVENATTLKNTLYKLDEIVDNMSDGSKELIEEVLQDVIKAVAKGDDSTNDISNFLPEDFSFSDVNFSSIGDAVVTIAEASENGDTEVSKTQADTIINALAENEVIVNALESTMGSSESSGIAGGLDATSKENIEAAISDNATIQNNPELKDKIMKLLGL